jgi:hypothetical protein
MRRAFHGVRFAFIARPQLLYYIVREAEHLMDRCWPFAFLLTLWLVPFQLGCERSQGPRNLKPALQTRPEPVLTADDDAKTVIEKAVKAHGGEKAFSRWKCGYVKYKTRGGIVPDQVGEVTVEDTFQLPGHFKRVTRVDTGGKELVIVFVVNHGKSWTKKGDGPSAPIDNDVTERPVHSFAGFCNLAPLTEAEVRLTKLGEEKIGGRQAMGVRVQSDKLGEVDFYIGSQTGLLLKLRKSLPSAEPERPTVVETFLDDYKDLQGAKIPMRIQSWQDSELILDVTLIDVKFAERFEDSTFAKP